MVGSAIKYSLAGFRASGWPTLEGAYRERDRSQTPLRGALCRRGCLAGYALAGAWNAVDQQAPFTLPAGFQAYRGELRSRDRVLFEDQQSDVALCLNTLRQRGVGFEVRRGLGRFPRDVGRNPCP